MVGLSTMPCTSRFAGISALDGGGETNNIELR